MSDEERIRLWRSLLNVRVGKGFEYVHTVILGMHYGYLPSQIDHKDRNGLNNPPEQPEGRRQ